MSPEESRVRWCQGCGGQEVSRREGMEALDLNSATEDAGARAVVLGCEDLDHASEPAFA